VVPLSIASRNSHQVTGLVTGETEALRRVRQVNRKMAGSVEHWIMDTVAEEETEEMSSEPGVSLGRRTSQAEEVSPARVGRRPVTPSSFSLHPIREPPHIPAAEQEGQAG
jgi:hypothetical protein